MDAPERIKLARGPCGMAEVWMEDEYGESSVEYVRADLYDKIRAKSYRQRKSYRQLQDCYNGQQRYVRDAYERLRARNEQLARMRSQTQEERVASRRMKKRLFRRVR
jgi:hypothetical protein